MHVLPAPAHGDFPLSGEFGPPGFPQFTFPLPQPDPGVLGGGPNGCCPLPVGLVQLGCPSVPGGIVPGQVPLPDWLVEDKPKGGLVLPLGEEFGHPLLPAPEDVDTGHAPVPVFTGTFDAPEPLQAPLPLPLQSFPGPPGVALGSPDPRFDPGHPLPPLPGVDPVVGWPLPPVPGDEPGHPLVPVPVFTGPAVVPEAPQLPLGLLPPQSFPGVSGFEP